MTQPNGPPTTTSYLASVRQTTEDERTSTDPTSGTPVTARAARRGGNDYDEGAFERLADEIAERLAARLGGLMPARAEPLVDAAQIARMYGKTRSWVYEHAGELGAVRLGSGPRPRLGFSPARVAAQLAKVNEPTPAPPPEIPRPRRRRQRAARTAAGAPLLHVRLDET